MLQYGIDRLGMKGTAGKGRASWVHSDGWDGGHWGVYGEACKCEHKEAGEGAHGACANPESPREGGHWLVCMCM